MKRSLVALLIAFTVSLALPSLVTAQDNSGVEGVTIQLLDENRKLVASTTTDANGKWSFGATNTTYHGGKGSSSLRASADYYLKIDDKAVSTAKMAINEKGLPVKKKKSKPSNARLVNEPVDADSDDDGVLYFEYNVKAPRDVATGQSSGKRQHGEVVITKEWNATTPILFHRSVEEIQGTVTYSAKAGKTGKTK